MSSQVVREGGFVNLCSFDCDGFGEDRSSNVGHSSPNEAGRRCGSTTKQVKRVSFDSGG